jgi:uncharacterized membrane protein
MLMLILAAFLLGVVAGLRTFTAPAVFWIVRHGGVWAIVLAVLAVVEYAGDLLPKAPARTGAVGLTARILSGAFCGWQISGSAIGAVAGAAGAVAGAYGGLALRVKAIAVIGAIPSGILEDLVAIGAAALIVTRAW